MNSGWPKMSVVTPSYNQGKFLEETIMSIHSQGYPLLEHIVIDGGSTDNSVDIIKKYEMKISYWVSERDRGQSDAINKGFRHATGDVLAWLNSDDVYRPGALLTVAEVFRRRPEVDAVFGDYDLLDADGKVLETKREIPFHFWTVLFGINYIAQPTVFVRRRVIDRVGLLDESLHYGMDWEWWLRMASKGCVFYHIPRILAGCRWHGSAKTIMDVEKVRAEARAIRRRYWTPGVPDILIPVLEWFFQQFYRGRRQIVKLLTRGTIDIPGRTPRHRSRVRVALRKG